MNINKNAPEKYAYSPTYGDPVEVNLTLNMYASNDNLYIGMEFFDPEYGCTVPYGDVTVNTDLKLPYLYATIDNNNNGPSIVPFLVEHDFGFDTGVVVNSGFCQFPVFKFSEDALKRIDPEMFQEYRKSHGSLSLDRKVKDAEIDCSQEAPSHDDKSAAKDLELD